MDNFFLYPLSLVLLLVSLPIIFHIRKLNIIRSNLPPGKTGWLIIGETREFKRSNKSSKPESFIFDRMKKFSPDVFRTSLFGENMAVFCGPAGNKFLFSNEYKLVTSWWPNSMKNVLTFPTTRVENSPNKELTKKHRFLHEILKPESLRSYIPIMDSLARKHLESEWVPHSEVNVFPLLKKYTFALACRIFMGIQEDSEHLTRLAESLAIVRAGYMSVPINFPGTTFNRSVKAGKVIREELLAIIKKRKHELSVNQEMVSQDLLSYMLLASDETGKFMSEMEISNQIIGSLIASLHTTSTAITFVLKYMAELPHIYREVLKEQMEITKLKVLGGLLNWDDIQKMKYSWNVASEAMRLSPPAQGSFRQAITDFTYAGFAIPKGWKTYWTTYSTHKNPKYFPDPEKFDPSRFGGDGPAPFTFVPFGGGPRICPGKEYARLEILVFMHNVVTKFHLERVSENENVILNQTTIAVNGLPIRLRPRQI